jgi:hypothetical protein
MEPGLSRSIEILSRKPERWHEILHRHRRSDGDQVSRERRPAGWRDHQPPTDSQMSGGRFAEVIAEICDIVAGPVGAEVEGTKYD